MLEEEKKELEVNQQQMKFENLRKKFSVSTDEKFKNAEVSSFGKQSDESPYLKTVEEESIECSKES